LDLSIILPIKNESPNIEPLYHEITAVALNLSNTSYEILFIDDGSTDDSYKKISQIARSDHHVKVIGFRRGLGKAAALSEGFRQAHGELLITMDGDGQDDPKDMVHLLRKMEQEDLDLVSGWKIDRKDPWPRILWSRIFNIILRYIFNTDLHDMNCGMKAYRSSMAKELHLYGDLHRFIAVLAVCSGYSVAEVPVNHRPRRYGRSKYGISRIFVAPMDLITVLFLTHFLVRPLHLFGVLGSLSGAAGFALCSYLAAGWIAKWWHIGDRPLIFLGILLLILGVQLVSIGLVCEMTIRAASGPLHTKPALRPDLEEQDHDDGKGQV